MAEEDSLEYERSEIIRHSLVPLIEDAVEDFHKLFTEAKKKTTFTNNVWKKHSKGDDYKVDAVLHMKLNNIEEDDIDSLRAMAQSFCDEANVAKRESALNAERNMNLQARLSSAETANVRLSKVVEEAETKIFDLLQKLNKEETTRISIIRELKEINDKHGNDKKGLRKELSSTKKTVHDLQAEKQKSDSERKQMEAEIGNLNDRVRYAESEAASLQTKLTEALKRESQSNSSLAKARNIVDDLKAELENERIKSQTRIEKIERDGKRNYGEKEHALQKQINTLKNEIAGLHEEYSITLENHQKAAKEAIERLTKDIEDLDASRMKYYKQYKELLVDLNDHKQKISHEVLKQAILKLTNEYRNDQLRTSKIRKGLQTVNLHDVTNFGDRCLEVLASPQHNSSSDGGNYRHHRNENQSPPPLPPQPSSSVQPRDRQRSTSVRDTAQRYDVRGQFKSNTRQ